MAIRFKQPSRFKGAVVAIAGGGLLIYAAVMAIQSLRGTWFHTVQGMVVSKKLDSVVVGKINLHKPIIEYSYVVDGIPYRNDTFHLVDNDGTEKWASSILRDYSVGLPCTVYYDPINPHVSALSTRPTATATWLMIGFTFLGLVHLIGGIFAIRFASLPNNRFNRSRGPRGLLIEN